MRKIEIVPHGFQKKWRECHAEIVLVNDDLIFVTEYHRSIGANQAYVIATGEAAHVYPDTLVQPCIVVYRDE